jgi:hypothetical protein
MVVDGRDLLVQLRWHLNQIENRLIDIEARLVVLGGDVANKPLTLREFTEKHLNDKIPDDQKTDSTNPRAAAKKYSTR